MPPSWCALQGWNLKCRKIRHSQCQLDPFRAECKTSLLSFTKLKQNKNPKQISVLLQFGIYQPLWIKTLISQNFSMVDLSFVLNQNFAVLEIFNHIIILTQKNTSSDSKKNPSNVFHWIFKKLYSSKSWWISAWWASFLLQVKIVRYIWDNAGLIHMKSRTLRLLD